MALSLNHCHCVQQAASIASVTMVNYSLSLLSCNSHCVIPIYIVCYRLPESVTVVKLSFSSRVDGSLQQSPTKFQLVGSNDCVHWKTISTFKAKFTQLNQVKSWDVPKKQRRAFKCIGIRVNEVSKGKFAAIQGMRMWAESNPANQGIKE